MRLPRRYSAIASVNDVSRTAACIRPVFFLFVLLLHFLMFLTPGSSSAESDKPNTLFLAAKVNAPADQEKLISLVDQVFGEILTAKGIALIPRTEAAKKLDYQKDWPPTPQTLAAFVDSPVIGYMTTGSVTKLGDQLSLDFTVIDLMGGEKPVYFVKESSEDNLAQAAKDLVSDILAHTGRYFLIGNIKISGNTRTDSGAILKKIKSQAGDRYAHDLLRQDLESIFKMGYFEDVQVQVEDSEKGKEVTFQVKEKAVIGQVIIDGEKEIDEDDIKEVVTVSTNTIINTAEVQTSVKNITKLYKEKGYYSTEVTANLDYPSPDKANVKFVIKEGFQVYIKDIRFSGNTAFDADELEEVMQTSQKGLFSWITESGRLKRDILDQDRARIAALYHNTGYIEAKVGEPEVTYEGKWLYITFGISEGERYRVGTIEVEGDMVGDKNDLYENIKLGQEKFFSRQMLRDDILRVTDYYAEKGYAFADVKPTLNKNDADKRMDVVIDVSKGALVHINRIVVKGNSRTRDRVIRREMDVKEGGILDATAIRKSSESLQRLEYFEEVNITPEPTAQEDKMDVVVDVKEKATGTFSIGAGYSSVDSLMFMGEISENNFLGKGQRLALQANVSSSNNRYNLSFTEPHVNDTPLLAGGDLYNWAREYDDYTRDSTGAGLRFGYPLWDKWNAFWGYGFDDTKMKDLSPLVSNEILDSQGVTSSVRFGVSKDTRNRMHDPTKGIQHTVSVKYAGGVVGGDFNFTKIEASSSWYHPTAWNTTVHLRGAAGYVLDNGSNTVPVYEKFYLGGINTIRGFDNSKISPINSNNERVGGEKMWYGNAEWIFPIIKEAGLKGVVFFDTGNVYDESETWDIGRLKKSVGTGFRWLSPMGPLRLEWGYNIDPDPDEEQGVWDFSLGGVF